MSEDMKNSQAPEVTNTNSANPALESNQPSPSDQHFKDLKKSAKAVWEDFRKEAYTDEDRKEFAEIKKEAKDVVADFKKNWLAYLFGLLIIGVLIYWGVGLFIRNLPENKAINAAQGMCFLDQGSDLGTNADLSLENVSWDSENLGNDRWAVYLNGYSPDYDTQLMIQVTLSETDDYTQGEVTYVEFDGVGYDDMDSIQYALAIVYDMVDQVFVGDYMSYLLGF